MSSIHAMFNGRTEDVEFDDVFSQDRMESLGITSATPATLSPETVKTALAQHFDVGVTMFQDHYVEVNPNGNITVRPDAKFG